MDEPNLLDRPWLDAKTLLGAPTTPEQPQPTTAPIQLTPAQRRLVMAVSGFVTAIAAIGFAGSYTAVTKLAKAKGFGWFAWAFPAGVDSGILGFLALDLLLTWLRMPYPLLRQVAWFLTAATISFNAYTSWGDPIAVGMHATIPILFVAAVEAGRHAVGRVADITADRHIESPPLIRWILGPWSTFRIWKRMRMWQLASYRTVIDIERETRMYRAQLRRRYGLMYRRTAAEHELLALTLARYGTPVHETLAAHAEEVRTAAARAAQEAAVQAEADRSTVDPGPVADRTVERSATPDRAAADRHPNLPDQADRTAPGQQRSTRRTAAPAQPRADRKPAPKTDRTDGPLVLSDTEQAAIDRLREAGRSISKRSIADMVRTELGQSIASDRAAEIARHFRPLQAA